MLEDRFAQHDKIPGSKYVEVFEDYELRTWDQVVLADTIVNNQPVTMTLPPVAEAKGRFYAVTVYKADSTRPLTIKDNGDSMSWTDVIVEYPGAKYLFYSDSKSWHVMITSYQP